MRVGGLLAGPDGRLPSGPVIGRNNTSGTSERRRFADATAKRCSNALPRTFRMLVGKLKGTLGIMCLNRVDHRFVLRAIATD